MMRVRKNSLVFETATRVRYAETDKFGVVYHSNYFLYFETGRTELLRSLGLPYSELERRGIFLVITECGCKHVAPARYDDLLRIKTVVAEFSRIRVRFEYTVEKFESSTLLAQGFTTLACVDANGRPMQIPRDLSELLTTS